MEASSLSFILFFFLSLFSHQSFSQQSYVGNETCSVNETSPIRGYICADSVGSCDSYLTFRSKPPYETRTKIGDLLGSYPIRNGSLDDLWQNPIDEIPSGSLVTVLVSCSCWGNSFKYNTDYVIARGDSYDKIANDVFQGLTSCSALKRENNGYAIDVSSEGRRLDVPLRCACPTQTQRKNGMIALLVHMVDQNESVASIAEEFGVDRESLLRANELSNSSHVYPFTPVLVPLRNETCRVKRIFGFCLREQDLHRKVFYPVYDGSTTDLSKLASETAVGIGIGFLIVVLAGYRAYQLLNKRRHKRNKEKFFSQNGGSLLRQKLFKSGDKVQIFTEEELKKATDNFSPSRFLGQGGYGTVYKGMLKDGTTVAVKKSKQMEKNWIDQFINEVVILSQINHKNVVKLLGCCLETEFPVLVYEFVSNGTLAGHIRQQDPTSSPLSLETRLKIASEVAGAISYMHSAASIPIFHRDIKSLNILLDDNYNAKISDFGTSRFVPCDQSHLTTKVQGTLGYIDPEYFRSSQYTDKSDVYSFGVLMVELLTGETPFTFAKEEGRNLLDYFISLENDNRLVEILDITIGKEANLEIVHSVAKLTIKCLRLNGKKRPAMKQVFLELEGLRKSQDYPEIVTVCQSDRISSMQSASTSYGELTDESIISIEMETT